MIDSEQRSHMPASRSRKWPAALRWTPRPSTAGSRAVYRTHVTAGASPKSSMRAKSSCGRRHAVHIQTPERQREIFLEQAAGAGTVREVLDAYMTSYFNAWRDNANLAGDKAAVTAFSARLAMNKPDLDAFLRDYADGRLVTIVREPRGWFESSRRYQPERYEDVARAVKTWRRSTRSSLDAKKRHGGRVYVLSFEALVRETEETMRRLADWVGIGFSDELVTPTFNGQPIRADSSREVAAYGVQQDRAEPPPLDEETRRALEAGTAELYERALSRMD